MSWKPPQIKGAKGEEEDRQIEGTKAKVWQKAIWRSCVGIERGRVCKKKAKEMIVQKSAEWIKGEGLRASVWAAVNGLLLPSQTATQQQPCEQVLSPQHSDHREQQVQPQFPSACLWTWGWRPQSSPNRPHAKGKYIKSNCKAFVTRL